MAIRNGSDGDDRLVGTTQADTIKGFAGNDIIAGRGGADDIDAGDGNDTVYLIDPLAPIIMTSDGPKISTLDVVGGAGYDTLVIKTDESVLYKYESSSFERVFSGDGDDILGDSSNAPTSDSLTIFGGAGDDVLYGGGVGDRLFGGDGNDILYGVGPAVAWLDGGIDLLLGGAGNDLLVGFVGQDILAGGSGLDRFRFIGGDFGDITRGGCDRIRDFSQAEHDRIVLNAIDADLTNAAHTSDTFTFVGTDAFSGTAAELRYEQVNGNTFVMGDWNGDAQADFMLALLGQHNLTADDFVL